MSAESLAWFSCTRPRSTKSPLVTRTGPDDANYDRRAVVIGLLTHDPRPSDAESLRHLLRQGIAVHAAGRGSAPLGLAAVASVGMGEVADVRR